MASKYTNNFHSSVGNVLQGDQATVNVQSQQIFEGITPEEITQLKKINAEHPGLLNKLCDKVLDVGTSFMAKFSAEVLNRN